jgi:hypothetical protein
LEHFELLSQKSICSLPTTAQAATWAMNAPSLCQDIIINIIHSYVATSPALKEWLSFRLVNRMITFQKLKHLSIKDFD